MIPVVGIDEWLHDETLFRLRVELYSWVGNCRNTCTTCVRTKPKYYKYIQSKNKYDLAIYSPPGVGRVHQPLNSPILVIRISSPSLDVYMYLSETMRVGRSRGSITVVASPLELDNDNGDDDESTFAALTDMAYPFKGYTGA
mmetsp:Transcript_35764/g.66257  ORF Transcript_35764/g.66257 Transcript_35764/m.66257 type:complete len:142 (+) Transcript_35764:436-861(+)